MWKLNVEVKETNEKFTLSDGEKFMNFNRLKELVGKDYDKLNDDLMNGPSENTWLDDRFNPIYKKYVDGNCVLTLQFHYEE